MCAPTLRSVPWPPIMIRPFWFDPNLAKLGEWLNDEGFRANIPALRAIYPDLMTPETFLRKSGWEHAAQ